MQETSLETSTADSNPSLDSSPNELISPSTPTPKRRPAVSLSSGRAPSVAWFLKPSALALVLALLTVGWGAYSVVSSPSSDADEVELADLEGFDDESPSLGQAETTSTAATLPLEVPKSRPFAAPGVVERAPQLPPTSAANSFELPPLSSLPSFQSARYERDPAGRGSNSGTPSSSGAWLNGTIESADDAPAKIMLPSRLSQGIVDGPAIR